jgi:hypothetical protein
MQQKSINTPYGGMDFDTANEYIAKDKVRYALNTRVVADDGTPLGRRTNLKGNTLVPNDLPLGQNECIGSYYDEGNSKMYYFVWNSNSNHSVYQFDDITKTIKLVYQDASLMFDLEHRINQINVIGGNILCWTDNQPEPKKILIDRGLNTYNGLREFNTYFNKNSLVGGVFTLTVTFKDGTPDFISGGISVPPFDTISELIEYLNVGFASSATNPAFPVVITGCDCTLTSVAKTTNVATVSFSTLGGYDVVTVANNFYPDTSISQFVDAIPYAPLDCPTTEYVIDTSVVYNNVSKNVFQFAYRYRYIGYEYTALSPYSIVAFNNKSCGTVNTVYNAIDISYYDAILGTSSTLSLIDGVEIYERTNETGKWYKIADINRCDIIENNFKYHFLNNGQYSILNDNSASKPYDYVPIRAKAQGYIKNILFYGKNQEKYPDIDCVNATISTSLIDIPSPKTYKAIVNIRIFNPQAHQNVGNLYSLYRNPLGWDSPFIDGSEINYYSSNYPIYRKTGFDYPVWGGIPRYDTQQRWENAPVSHGQIFGEYGWPVYCAGTDHWTISRQNQVGVTQINGVIQDYDEMIKTYNSNSGFDCFSSAVIDGLLPGKYTLRLGSHWCSYGDKLGKGINFDLFNGRSFHNTSTQLIGIRKWVSGNVGSFEPLHLGEFEIEVEIIDQDVFAGEMYVWDMIDTRKNISSSNYTPMHVYLADTQLPDGHGGFSDAPTLSKNGVYMESQYIMFPNRDGLLPLLTSPDSTVIDGQQINFFTPASDLIAGYNDENSDLRFLRVTDHNGFVCSNWYGFQFWNSGTEYNTAGQLVRSGGHGQSFMAIGYDARVLNNGLTNVVYRNAYNVYSGSPDTKSIINFFVNDPLGIKPTAFDEYEANRSHQIIITSSLAEFILPNYSQYYSDNYRTTVKGKVVDISGNGVSTTSVAITQTGRTSITDKNGDFEILVYASVWRWNQWFNPGDPDSILNYRGIRLDDVLLYLGTGCISEYTQNYRVFIGDFVYPFNNTSPLVMGNIGNVFTHIEFTDKQQFKQFGRYQLGIEYLDGKGRRSTVYTGDNLILNVPGSAGTGSFKTPAIDWAINHPAPDWAKRYQWVRTKELTRESYLQWAVSDVLYMNDYSKAEGKTDYTLYPCPFSEATYIWLDLFNLYDYKKRYPQSNIGYTFSVGDRIILIAKSDSTVYSKYYEVPIVAFLNTGILIENIQELGQLTTGTLVEIFTPFKPTDGDNLVFYEFGEVFTCDNGVHSVTSGRFNHGDTYIRRRFIDVVNPYASFSKWYQIEANTASDFYNSSMENIGRLNVVSQIKESLVISDIVRWGNRHIDNESINALFSFDIADNIHTSKSYGAITGIVVIGNILIIQQERQTISFYVDESILRNIRGTDIVGVSSQVLQSYNVLVGGFGCVNQEGIVANRNNFVFPDSTRGNMVKYGGNGTINISGVDEQNKSNKLMNAYFKKRLNDILAGGQVVGTYDRFLNEWVFITRLFTKNNVLAHGVIGSQTIFTLGGTSQFVAGEKVYVDTVDGRNILIIDSWDSTSRELRVTTTQLFPTTNITIVKINTESVGYSEIIDEWSSFYAYYEAEQGQYVNNGYAIFSNGQLWLSHTNPTRNNLFGKQYTSQVRVIPNDMPNENKIWQSLMINQDSVSFKWAAPVIKNDSGQLSRILNNIFKKLEYFWYAEFKKDLNTVSVSNPILNGKEIRSNTIDILLENDSTEDAQLTQVSVGWIPSQRTNK